MISHGLQSSCLATKQLWRRKISKAIGHFGDQGVEVYQILLRRVGAYGVHNEHIRFTRLSKVLFTTSICASKFYCHRGLREKSLKVFGQKKQIDLKNKILI